MCPTDDLPQESMSPTDDPPEEAKRKAEGLARVRHELGENDEINAEIFSHESSYLERSILQSDLPSPIKRRLFVSRLPSFDPSGEFLYGTYRLLFHCDAPLHNKQKAFEASALCDTSWFVESISLAAAERLLEKGNASGVRRAHAMSRSERAKAMFVRTDLMPKDEMLEFFLRHDSTTVVTTEENNQPGDSHWSPLIPVPAGYFTSPSFKIRLRKTVELSWLHQELASRR